MAPIYQRIAARAGRAEVHVTCHNFILINWIEWPGKFIFISKTSFPNKILNILEIFPWQIWLVLNLPLANWGIMMALASIMEIQTEPLPESHHLHYWQFYHHHQWHYLTSHHSGWSDHATTALQFILNVVSTTAILSANLLINLW